MLLFLDILLTIVHLGIILFNLFGWIPRKTRKAHFISILITAGSWFILGLWFGMGYCPFTDWQWEVKERLGETNLPPNFVEYFAEKITGTDFDRKFVTDVIMYSFVAASMLSVYVTFVLPKNHAKPQRGKEVKRQN